MVQGGSEDVDAVRYPRVDMAEKLHAEYPARGVQQPVEKLNK